MHLVLTSYGAYLYRRDGMFKVKIGEEEKEISARKVSSILVGTSASFSTDAVQLAIENNIDIVLVDKYGNPYARIWHGRLGSTARIRRSQLIVSANDEGLDLAREWILKKFDNQIEFLTDLRERRSRLSAFLTSKINELRELRQQLEKITGTINEHRPEILGLEGRAGYSYFQALSETLPENYRFAQRSRNPAQDAFNCFLNYAYGVLYSKVERACLLAGLDPYIGFLHTDNYNKPSLVFDLIENYRIWADTVVSKLFYAHEVQKSHFDELANGLILNKEGKTVLLNRYLPFLEEVVRYRRRKAKRRDIIVLDCHRIAQKLMRTQS